MGCPSTAQSPGGETWPTYPAAGRPPAPDAPHATDQPRNLYLLYRNFALAIPLGTGCVHEIWARVVATVCTGLGGMRNEIAVPAMAVYCERIVSASVCTNPMYAVCTMVWQIYVPSELRTSTPSITWILWRGSSPRIGAGTLPPPTQ